MKKHFSIFLILLFTLVFFAPACGPGEQEAQPPVRVRATITSAPIATATLTPEYDPCASENLPDEVEKVHKIMREFDDTALLASNTPLDQLNPTILELQRIRRESEDLTVPSCLTTLKQYQLAHMNTVINTLLGFLSGAEAEAINQGIITAREQHDQYTHELANLLGLTVVSAPTLAPVQETLPPDVTPTLAPLVVINPGPTTVNLRAGPDLNADPLGILEIGANAIVLGRTADALWYQVEFPNQPGQTAWVYASLVQLSDPTAELQVVEPTP